MFCEEDCKIRSERQQRQLQNEEYNRKNAGKTARTITLCVGAVNFALATDSQTI